MGILFKIAEVGGEMNTQLSKLTGTNKKASNAAQIASSGSLETIGQGIRKEYEEIFWATG